MFRFLTPLVLIGIAVAGFFLFTNPLYEQTSALRAESASYNEALDNSKALETERDKLTAKYNSIDPENLAKIKKLLPDSIDNIRLILEIGQIASPYGMVLKDVKYNVAPESNPSANTEIVQGGGVVTSGNKDYGVWDLEFSTAGTYTSFVNFLRSLESNLRIVDIASITFSSDVGQSANSSSPDVYNYHFKIKTYWLKN
jgi:Tfp pilus assembly protein PilO